MSALHISAVVRFYISNCSCKAHGLNEHFGFFTHLSVKKYLLHDALLSNPTLYNHSSCIKLELKLNTDHWHGIKLGWFVTIFSARIALMNLLRLKTAFNEEEGSWSNIQRSLWYTNKDGLSLHHRKKKASELPSCCSRGS